MAPRAVPAPEPPPESSETAVSATINFPIYLMDVEFPLAGSETLTNQEKQAWLAQLALETLQKYGIPEPIIHECSDEDLVE